MKKLFTILVSLSLSHFLQGNKDILPKPSGPFSISIKYLHFIDGSREELFSNTPGGKREITVKAWYPTDDVSAPEPYFQNVDFVIKYCWIPETFRELRTNSGRDLPVSSKEKKFPVLLFSHGWGEHFSQNTILMEELASRGYIVFSLAHHFECRFSSYPDGRMIPLDINSRRFQKIWRELQAPKVQELILRRIKTAKNDEERRQIFMEIERTCPTALIETPKYWVEDISFILDQLTEMNKTGKTFKNTMDLDRIGVFGMSMGGTAANQISMTDKRIKAGLNMDGGPHGSVLNGKLQVPFLFLNSAKFLGYGHFYTQKSTADCYSMSVKDSEHMNFTDYSLYPAPYARPQLGRIDGHRIIRLMNVIVPAFFDKYLKEKKEIDLMALAAEFPEVESVNNFN